MNCHCNTQMSMNPNGTSPGPAKYLEEAPGKTRTARAFLAGILLASLSGFFFCATSLIVQLIPGVSRTQLAFYRYLIILLMSAPSVLESGQPIFGPSVWSFRLWMLLRGLFGSGATLLKYHALSYISLANVTVVTLSTPIFVFAFARLLLREAFGRYHALSLVLSLLGIALASKVHLMLSELGESPLSAHPSQALGNYSGNLTDLIERDSSETGGAHLRTLIGNLFALGSTVLTALVFVFLRKMSTVHHSIVLFNFSWIAMAELGPISWASGDSFALPLEGYTPYLLIALGGLSFYAQVLLTKATQMEEAGIVSVVKGSAEAIFSFLGEMLIFAVNPDVYSITGAALVLCSVLLLTFRKYILSCPVGSPIRDRFHFLTI